VNTSQEELIAWMRDGKGSKRSTGFLQQGKEKQVKNPLSWHRLVQTNGRFLCI